MKTYLWSLILILSSFHSFSQNQVSGKITDTNSNPLAFANVILHHHKDQAVTGTTTNNQGEFSFSGLPDGDYRLEISMIGYKTINGESFSLSSETPKVQENFILQEETEMLGDVIVESKRPKIRQTAEKLILDIEHSPSVNSNLQDVIKKVPGVILMNGNLSYGGQSGITILINGKTTEYLDMESLLRNMPADNIAKIELIQQPGA